MGLQDEVDVLQKLPLFASMDCSRLKLLAFTSERVFFQPQQLICQHGEEGDAAYIVISGSAEVLVPKPEGEIKLANITASGIIGEIAILCDIPRTASVRAIDTVDALRIDKENFLHLVREFPDIGIEIMRELAVRLIDTTEELLAARMQADK